ncbi:hypothetical protein BKA93DRAFT_749497 [Sparassis latifolia]
MARQETMCPAAGSRNRHNDAFRSTSPDTSLMSTRSKSAPIVRNRTRRVMVANTLPVLPTEAPAYLPTYLAMAHLDLNAALCKSTGQFAYSRGAHDPVRCHVVTWLHDASPVWCGRLRVTRDYCRLGGAGLGVVGVKSRGCGPTPIGRRRKARSLGGELQRALCSLWGTKLTASTLDVTETHTAQFRAVWILNKRTSAQA